MSIGSLYQYFPDKRAIVRTLAERYTAEAGQCIERPRRCARPRGLARSLAALVDQYYAIVPGGAGDARHLVGHAGRQGVDGDELAESRANGALLDAVMRRVHPGADPEKTAASAFLVWQLGEATMRLAVSLPRKEGDAIVETYKRMTLREIAEV